MQAILDQEDMSNLSKEDRLEYIMYLIWHPVRHQPRIKFRPLAFSNELSQRCAVSDKTRELRAIYLDKVHRNAIHELSKHPTKKHPS